MLICQTEGATGPAQYNVWIEIGSVAIVSVIVNLLKSSIYS